LVFEKKIAVAVGLLFTGRMPFLSTNQPGIRKTQVFFKKSPIQWVFWVLLGFGLYWVFGFFI